MKRIKKTCDAVSEASVVQNMAGFVGYHMTEWSWIDQGFLLVFMNKTRGLEGSFM